MSFKDLALPMAALNVPIIRLQPRSKVPMDTAWQNLATTDIDKILMWDKETPGANCASVAKSDGVLFFEADEPDVIERYEKETGEVFPETFRVKSREGRSHFYFLQTDETRACGSITQKEIPFGSLRQNNAYCVSPGSIHPDTKEPYEVEQDVPIVPFPTKFLEWLQAERSNNAAAQKASNPLVKTKAPIPYGQHDLTLTAIAGAWWQAGVPKDLMLPGLIQECEERAVGYKEDYREMCAKIVKSITTNYKQGSADPTVLIGGKLPQGVVQPPPQVLPQPSQPDYWALLQPENLSDKSKKSWILENTPKANQLSAKPLTWVIENMILENGLHLFSGKQGSMKSLTAMMLAKSIVDGEAFMGRKNVGRPITVVYIDRENPQAEMRRRCYALGLLETENFRIWGDWDPENQPPASFDDPRLMECAKRDDVLFVFDSLSSYLNGADENSTGEMMEIMGKARRLARACAGVIIIHHQAKNGTGSRGNTSISASTDMAFVVEKQGNDVHVSEERFRACASYTMNWTMNFVDPSGQYKYIVQSNGLSGDRAIIDPTATEAAHQDSGMSDFIAIKRAGEAVEDHYKLTGKPLNQSQLAMLAGITSNSAKSRLLNGASDRPWKCIPNGRSVLFVPKEKKYTKEPDTEEKPPIVGNKDIGPPIELN